MGYVTITLSENITNYDYVDVELCYSTSGGTSTHVYCRTSDLMSSSAWYSGASRIIACSAAATSGGNNYYRYIGSTNGIEVFISGANCVAATGASNNLAIPVTIAGIKGSLPPTPTLIYLGSGTTSINVSSKVPDYASATSNNFIVMPTAGTSTTGSRIADQQVTVYIDKSGPSYNSSTGVLSYSIRARAQQGSYLLTTTGYISWNAYYTSVPITELA